MPNHVTNILRIDGEDIEKVLSAIKGKEKDGEPQTIDFNKIHPCPQALFDTPSGSNVFDAQSIVTKIPVEFHTIEKIQVYLKEHIEIIMDIPSDVMKCILNFIQYGHASWYEWCCSEWGTKWNAYHIVEQEDPSVIQFDTAWSTPMPVIAKLSQMFPENTFSIEYADEDIGSNCGKYAFQNGAVIEEWIPSGEEEAREFACDVKGYNYEEEFGEKEEV